MTQKNLSNTNANAGDIVLATMKDMPRDFSYKKSIDVASMGQVFATNWDSDEAIPLRDKILPNGYSAIKFTARIHISPLERSLKNFPPSVPRVREYARVVDLACIDFLHSDFSPLALRYANNIANGSFLGYNYRNATNARIVVKSSTGNTYRFYPYDFSLTDISDNAELVRLANEIADALQQKNLESTLFLDVEVTAQFDKYRRLYHLNIKRDSQDGHPWVSYSTSKIKEEFHKVDVWYSPNETLPLEVGCDSYPGNNFVRDLEYKNTIHYLLHKLHLGMKLTDNEMYYVMANIIHGGVFGRM